jgi:DNA-binding transcriptional regulator GbsR (MarR family)
MADPGQLTDEQREYIESMGVFFEHYGLPRLVGRLLSLLMLADRPLTLDDMAQALLVSRASVSTNIRIALHNEYAVRVGILGDRRDYYRFSDDVWVRRTQIMVDASKASRAMAERGLATLAPDDTRARERLEEMREYCDFSIEESRKMQARWLERKRALRASFAAGRAVRHPQVMTGRVESGVESGATFDDESVTIERNR